MRLAMIAFSITVVLALGGVIAYQKLASGEWHLPDGESVVRLPRRVLGTDAPRVMHTIYLERHGATLAEGTDDSFQNRSSVVKESNRHVVKIPAFRGGDAKWKQLLTCLRAQYAPFDVLVTDEKPTTRGYVLVVVGGKPGLLGFPATTGGLAPYSSEVVPDPVVFVFSDNLAGRVQIMCETAAMEIAHAYGLDHEYLCKDPMSYLSGCGKKTFQDKTVRCGEKRERDCGDGQPTQNSFARLTGVLGAHR